MDIDTMVENHFKKNRDIFGFESIARLIEEVMDSMAAAGIDTKLLQEQPGGGGGGTPESDSFDWNAIPEINISELGWTQMQTPEEGGEQVAGPQRKILEQYLEKIVGTAGKDLQSKLDALNKFTAEGPTALGADATGGVDQIGAIMSYLVFYKTLTRVITNFNAASAGFNFESFLAVLLGGTQIATGSQTIADIKVPGDPEYYSLKLYAESGVEVGGSWQDLVDDLANQAFDNKMTYLVVLKNLSGEGMDLEGTLSFYEFEINLENVADFMLASGKDSKRAMFLPLVKDPETGLDTLVSTDAPAAPDAEEESPAPLQEWNEWMSGLKEAPEDEASQEEKRRLGRGRVRVTPEQLEAEREKQLQGLLAQAIEKSPEFGQIIQTLGGPEALGSQAEFKVGGPIFRKPGKKPGRAEQAAIQQTLLKLVGDNPELWNPEGRGKQKGALAQMVPTLQGKRSNALLYLRDLIGAAPGLANQELRKGPEAARVAASKQPGVKAAFEAIMKEGQAGLKRSVDYYNSLESDEEKAGALHMTYGYVGPKALHFFTGKKYVTQGGSIGVLQIGAEAIATMIEKARDKLNTDVYTIFQTLKVLSTNLNTYFASGLQDEKSGDGALAASQELTQKTEKAVAQTSEEK